MNNENGFIKISRQILEWKYVQNPNALALWIQLLLMANWKDGYFMGTTVPRGSLATSIQSLASKTGMHPNTVRKWLKKFENENQISTKSTNRFTLISISNYNTFQAFDEGGYVKRNVKQDVKPDVKQSVKQDGKQRVDNRRSKEYKKERIKEESIEKKIPTLPEVVEFFESNSFVAKPQKFFDYYSARGWKDVNDWQALARYWESNEYKQNQPQQTNVVPMPSYMQKQKEEMMQQDEQKEKKRIVIDDWENLW